MNNKCKRLHIQAPSVVDYQEFGNLNAQKIVLLLHGYAQNLEIIQESFSPIIGDEHHWIIPNGVFPIPKKRKDTILYRFAWYFYNTITEEYFIDFTYPTKVLKGLLEEINTADKEVIIIGYSQGGYLAPFAALEIPHVNQVIGINCNFRSDMLPSKIDLKLDAIHNINDPLVSYENSLESFNSLRSRIKSGDHHGLSTGNHEIDTEILEKVTSLLFRNLIIT